jgi:hypothetical protein
MIDKVANRVARRFLSKAETDVPPDFQGNPEVHGIDEPRGGGFSIMQTLQEDLVKEEKKEREGSRIASRFAGVIKQAMYWHGRGRTYRMTRNEQNGGPIMCPRCKGVMDSEKFTRSEQLLSCPGCGFKIPTGKVVKRKVEIEIEPNGEVEVEVTEASDWAKKRRTNHGL